MAIDLSASYAKAVRDALPQAVIVADKFHLSALGNQMLTEVRQHATRAARGRRGTKKDPEWAARRRLLLGQEGHTGESFARMWNALIDAGDPGIEVLHAYTAQSARLRRAGSGRSKHGQGREKGRRRTPKPLGGGSVSE